MKPTRQNLGNFAIAAVALILFAGFVVLATRGGDKDNGNLSTVAPTSTTERPSTTTTEPEETTTSLLATTTTNVTAAPATTPATTKKPTTATTRKPTTTTTSASKCVNGQATEASDNKDSFTYDGNAWVSHSSSDQPNRANFPLEFTIATAPGVVDPKNIQYTVRLTNNTNCAATFGDNLKVVITLTHGADPAITFIIGPDDQHKVTDIQPHEEIKLTQERGLSGSGTFEATGTVQINYG